MGSLDRTRDVAVRVGSKILRRHGTEHLRPLSVIEAMPESDRPSLDWMNEQFRDAGSLLSAAFEYAMTEARAHSLNGVGAGAEGLVQFARNYLSADHVRAPEQGCALPTVGGEMARATREVRAVFGIQLELLVRDLVRLTEMPRARVEAVIAMCVGAVMLARAHGETDAAEEIVGSALTNATALARG